MNPRTNANQSTGAGLYTNGGSRASCSSKRGASPRPIADNPRRAFGLAIAAIAAAVALLWANPSRGAGLLIADGGLGGVLEIEEHEVQVTINNGVAVTQVNQVFRNTENRQVEALYTFPVPKGASVSNFSMWIGGKEMIGEVVEKKRAREIYDSYKRQNRDPGLLEQVNYKTFEMRIFPIAAGAEQRVSVTYYQELDFDHDWATYVYPLATATRANIDQRARKRFAFSLDVESEVPIAEAASPSHKGGVLFVRHSDEYWQASLETKEGDLSRDIVVAYRATRPTTGVDLIASRDGGEDGYFLMTLTPGEELKGAAKGKDYVFVLDVSGSMGGEGKLGLSTRALGAFIDGLGADDRFEIMTFNMQPRTLFNKLEGATSDTRQRAGEFLASQSASGGTVLEPALAVAWRYADPDRELAVVVLSDGMTEQKERRALLAAVASKPALARLFCVGVGNETNRPLLEQLAQETGGLAAFLSSEDDLSRQAKGFQRKLTRPVADGVKIAFDGGDVYDMEPAGTVALYHGSPARFYGRYRKNGPVKATLTATIAGKPFEQKIDLELPAKDADNPQIERMWAWRRTQSLEREMDRGISRDQAVGEIIRLGEGYSIVTEYTSFLVLENDQEYKRWNLDRKNALRMTRDRAAQERVRQQLDQLRNKALSSLGPSAAEEAKRADMPQQMAAVPSINNPAMAQRSVRVPAAPQRPSRNVDIDLPSFGGGAIDPFAVFLTIILVGGIALATWDNNQTRRSMNKEGR